MERNLRNAIMWLLRDPRLCLLGLVAVVGLLLAL
jgi:hypothetical protein